MGVWVVVGLELDLFLSGEYWLGLVFGFDFLGIVVGRGFVVFFLLNLWGKMLRWLFVKRYNYKCWEILNFNKLYGMFFDCLLVVSFEDKYSCILYLWLDYIRVVVDWNYS